MNWALCARELSPLLTINAKKGFVPKGFGVSERAASGKGDDAGSIIPSDSRFPAKKNKGGGKS